MEIYIHGTPALIPLTYTWRQIFILTLPDDNNNLVGDGITILEHI